jgi:hypothetical protein
MTKSLKSESSSKRKLPDKCLRCAALSADQAKALHGEAGDNCWERQICPSRRSYLRHRDRRNQSRNIFQVQAGLIFEALEATATQDGPTMSANAFDRYVRQYMAIDFGDYIEKIEALPQAARTIEAVEDGFYSVAGSVDKTELLEVLHDEVLHDEVLHDEILLTDVEAHAEALSVAHGEDISQL